uniref:Transposase n=1 Tax=Panagrolaimus sp. ES5 TaxID=591445 RepID=A0AC34FUT6_9BILA
MAKELSKILGFNITRYQAAYQFKLYRENTEKIISNSSIKGIKKDDPAVLHKKFQSKLYFKKKQKSPSSSPNSIVGAIKKLSTLHHQQQQITKQQNRLFKYLFKKFGKDVEDEDVMQPKSRGFINVMPIKSEKFETSHDDAMSSASDKSQKFEGDAMSFTSENSFKSALSFDSADTQEFFDAKSSSSLDNYESNLSDSSKSTSFDKKGDKKVTFKDDIDGNLDMDNSFGNESELKIDTKENTSFDIKDENGSRLFSSVDKDKKAATQVNKKGQILTDYFIRKNSKLNPMVVINRNDKWYSYTVKSTGLKSQRYECNLCPRHSKFKSKGIMKNKMFWAHPKHSPLCKPMTKEELEALQIDRDIREDVSKGYHIQDSYVVGYKKALKQGVEKQLRSIENMSKSLDRWKAKTYPESKKGKVAEEHKVLLDGEKFLIYEDKTLSVFMSDEAATTMANCRILVADPTFRTSPQGFMQTLYIHGLVETPNGTEWRPLLMAPIDSKKEEDYLKVVNAIKKRWQELGLKPKFERFHTDYEKSLFNAFGELNGIDKMYGCLFHYDKAVLKSVKDCGLFGYYFTKKGKKIPEYKAIKKWVRTIMALPMLPKEDIPILAKELLKIPQPPMDSKVKWPTEELEKLKTYVESEWLNVFQEKDNNKWCFYGLGRTKNTNAGEGYHSGLSKTMPKKPKYKVFLEIQKNRFSMNNTRIYKLKNTTVKTKCISEKYKELAERIERLEARLEKQKKMQHTPEAYVEILRKHCEAVSYMLHEVRNKSLQTLKSKKIHSKSYNKESESEDNDSIFSDISEERNIEDDDNVSNETNLKKKKDSKMIKNDDDNGVNMEKN